MSIDNTFKICSWMAGTGVILGAAALVLTFNNVSNGGSFDLHQKIPEIVARESVNKNLSEMDKIALTANLTKQADLTEMNDIKKTALGTALSGSLALLYGYARKRALNQMRNNP